LPVAARDRRPLLIDVAADEPASGGKRRRNRQRTVAREGADLDRAFGADGPDQKREQRRLIGADLHACLPKPRGFRAQLLLDVGFARDVLSDIALDGVGKERAAHSAKDAMERFAWQPRSTCSLR